VTWLAGPRTLGERIIPRLHAAAAGRPAPRVVAALPVAVCADADLASRTADEILARYAGFDNYRRLLDREGVSAPGGVAVVGDEAAIEHQVKGLSDLGVTELWPIVFPVGDDAAGSRRRTRALLAALASA
jgi:5,10-methylenetetrahydromethanopterin reductase